MTTPTRHSRLRILPVAVVLAAAGLMGGCATDDRQPESSHDPAWLTGSTGDHALLADGGHGHGHGHAHGAEHFHSGDGDVLVAQPGPGGRPPGGPGGPPPMRRHTVNQSDGVETIPANRDAPGTPSVRITEEGDYRIIRVNGIPKHQVGRFPNAGNPNRIRAQSYRFRVPLEPRKRNRPTPVDLNAFGVAVNGVPFDPGAAEFWQGDRNSGWQYEALSGAVPLGVDANHAHVQPNGAYHYHGLPTGLLKELELSADKHSPLVGWAADGFPVYARYGYEDPDDPESDIVDLSSSYKLKSGQRPGAPDGPGGRYDGTFVADYEFDEDHGDLDACNARWCKTPEFPDGTWAYFLTASWPVIPRYHLGAADSTFRKGPPNRRGR